MTRNSGFTLTELLIVVAIIAILAAIAIPNFLEAQIRAKLARAKSDLQALGSCLEMYFVDNNAYPMCSFYAMSVSPPSLDEPMTLERLSTPVAYISNSALRDPFGVMARYSGRYFENESAINETDMDAAQFYKYTARNTWSNAQWRDLPNEEQPKWWVLECVGPDRRYHNLGSPLYFMDGSNPQEEQEIAQRAVYDPTNGTVSRGSLWKVGGCQSGIRGKAFWDVIKR